MKILRKLHRVFLNIEAGGLKNFRRLARQHVMLNESNGLTFSRYDDRQCRISCSACPLPRSAPSIRNAGTNAVSGPPVIEKLLELRSAFTLVGTVVEQILER